MNESPRIVLENIKSLFDKARNELEGISEGEKMIEQMDEFIRLQIQNFEKQRGVLRHILYLKVEPKVNLKAKRTYPHPNILAFNPEFDLISEYYSPSYSRVSVFLPYRVYRYKNGNIIYWDQ
jgi:hypothetical protein